MPCITEAPVTLKHRQAKRGARPRGQTRQSTLACPTMTRRAWSVLSLLLALAVLPADAQTGQPSSATTAWYTSAQADLGRRNFATNCAACHGASMFTIFRHKSSAASYYNFISGSMPKHLPGSLPEEDYVSIVAFMLSAWGFPAGNTELTADRSVLKHIIPADGRAN